MVFCLTLTPKDIIPAQLPAVPLQSCSVEQDVKHVLCAAASAKYRSEQGQGLTEKPETLQLPTSPTAVTSAIWHLLQHLSVGLPPCLQSAARAQIHHGPAFQRGGEGKGKAKAKAKAGTPPASAHGCVLKRNPDAFPFPSALAVMTDSLEVIKRVMSVCHGSRAAQAGAAVAKSISGSPTMAAVFPGQQL